MSESSYFEKGWQQSYWGSNYPRLAEIKRKYDPDGLLFVHHGVGSEQWSADGFTKGMLSVLTDSIPCGYCAPLGMRDNLTLKELLYGRLDLGDFDSRQCCAAISAESNFGTAGAASSGAP